MPTLHADSVRAWTKFLNPDELRTNLIVSSLFLAAFETLESCVVDQVREFYANGFGPNGLTLSPEYESRVLSRHKSPFRSSMLWLLDSDAVSEKDLELVDRIREHRNRLAHQLPTYIATADVDVDTELLAELCGLVAKIDRWWFREVEMTINPDWDGKEINAEEVMSGRMLFLHLMLQAAVGDQSKAKSLFDMFVAQANVEAQPAVS